MRIHFTHHADQRRVEHGFTVDQVLAAVSCPELAYPAGYRWPDREVRVLGPVKSIVSSSEVVITVMPADSITGYQKWYHDLDTD